MPLGRAFWLYAIVYGTLANLVATLLALATVSSGLPAWLAVAVFLLPLPYNVTAAVGTWRSAGRYSGNPLWATAARVAVVVWVITATLA